MNNKNKKSKNIYNHSVTRLACVMAFSCSTAIAAPSIPDTDDTTWRYQTPSQPGWSNIVGSCDTSSADTYGREAAANAFNSPSLAGYVDPVDPLPNAGHSHFTSCGTWLGGESAEATISGLTTGEIYQISFYVAGYRPLAEQTARTYEVGNIYRLDVGDESSGFVNFNSTAWIAQTFSFTADDTTETVTIQASGDTTRRSVTHFSIAADSIVILDSDQDGLTDSQELAVGSDINNADSDADGLTDADELNVHGTNTSAADTDSDGLSDFDEINTYNTDPTKADTDGGGVTDGVEVANGTDPLSNNTDDIVSIDSDGDGLTDDVETSLASDPNNTDTDGDGLNDGEEVNTHSTSPSNPDTDEDGLTDGEEITTQLSNPINPDTDGDGLQDGAEVSTYNTDPNKADTDGDTLTDGAEVSTHGTNPVTPDTDGDGLDDESEINMFLTDPLNSDSDNDGLTDGDEVTTTGTDPNNADTDNSSVSDGEEVNTGADPLEESDDVQDLDFDNDGIPNLIEGTGDQDEDGIPNALDLDSDNDGIPDLIEAGGSDADNNGLVDNLLDANNDGLDDAVAALPLPVADLDGDGLANFLDIDSDQDGLSDIFEAGGIDTEDNGLVDNQTDNNGDGWADEIAAAPLPLTDTDGDLRYNFIDIDSDNDGLFDLTEAGGTDVDNDGQIDSFLDTDADGIPDVADIDSTSGTDSDSDGIDDMVDASITLGADINGNGIDDSIEADVDGDGRATGILNNSILPDEDGDGIVDVNDVSIGAAMGFVTGVNGNFGCSISSAPTSKFDPLLALLAILSCGLIVRRRNSAQRSNS